MKLLFFVNILLVNTVQSELVDYCGIEPMACASHVFDISAHGTAHGLMCAIQPSTTDELQEDYMIMQEEDRVERFEQTDDEPIRHTATILNETAVECKLAGIPSARVILEDTILRDVVDIALVFPPLCFKCDADFLCYVSQTGVFQMKSIPVNGLMVNRTYGGCYIDSTCYPNYLINPANFSQWCANNTMESWSDVTTGPVDLQYPALVDTCQIKKTGLGSITRAMTPEEAGIEGLDLTANDAYFNVGTMKHERLTIETNFKMYVKFDTKPVTENETFFEIPSMLKIQRTVNDAIVAEYSFLDSNASQVIKVVPLMLMTEAEGENSGADENTGEAGWIQLIGIKMSINHNRRKRQEVAKWVRGEWNMIGFRYNIHGGTTSLKWYLNGNEVEVHHGNTTGLYLRGVQGPILSNGQFSCLEVREWGIDTDDDEFFKDPNLTTCINHYREKPASTFEECTRDYYTSAL